MDPFDSAWQVAKTDEDMEKSFLSWMRNNTKTKEDRMAMAQRIERANAMIERRRLGLPSQPMSATEQQSEIQGLPLPPAPAAPAAPVAPAAPAPENEAENVEANIPMPEEVDDTKVHVEEGEGYNPEPVHEQLPGREVPDVDDLVQGMSKDEASEKLTELFNRIGNPEERERMIASIPQRIERFSDKLPNLIQWAEQKVATMQVPETEEPERESVADRVARITGGDEIDNGKFPIISPTTSTDEILRVFEMAEGGDEDARKHLYNNMGDLEDHFPDLATRYGESFEKHFVLDNPFANPFYDTSFNKLTKTPQRSIANPIPVAPMEIIKEETPKEIDGFAMNENDDLSLLPSSVFASNDAPPVADNLSLLPAGWNADVE